VIHSPASRSWKAPPARAAAGLLAVMILGGCDPQAAPKAVPDQHPQVSMKAKITRLEAEVASLRRANAEKARQIEALQNLPADRMKLMFTVTKVEIGRYSAGRDLDGKTGHDGVRVYLTPKDRDGHTIKAAGSVSVRLFDLARDGDNLLARCDFPADKIARHWVAGLGSHHYRFDCPWPRPPTTGEVTLRVTFTDLLTGKSHTAQRTLKVTPAPAPK